MGMIDFFFYLGARYTGRLRFWQLFSFPPFIQQPPGVHFFAWGLFWDCFGANVGTSTCMYAIDVVIMIIKRTSSGSALSTALD